MSRNDRLFVRPVGWLKRNALAVLACGLWAGLAATVAAEDAQWIWSPEHEPGGVPATSCYFRKTFNLPGVEKAELYIAADDQYELYLNGRRIGTGTSWDSTNSYDVTRHLLRGKNVIAVKATNTDGGTAALAVRVSFQLPDNERGYLISDATWRSSLRTLPFWTLRVYNDRSWDLAHSYGPVGVTPPWIIEQPTPTLAPPPDEPQPELQPEPQPAPVAALEPQPAPRPEAEVVAAAHGDFVLNEEFAIELVMSRERTGSLIAMTFNEFGEILCSQEDGPLLIVTDENKDTIPDQVRVWCDKLKNCQGLLALNGDVFAVADGPQGPALYRVSDSDGNGTGETVVTVLRFTDEMGEHGPHGLVLGPDGLLYVVLGNYSQPLRGFSPNGPYREAFEGDLVQPRLEDSYKHALGVPAPGGTIIRTNITGDFAEVVAGGLRNAYDIAFNAQGDLFTVDSDMEWDKGLPWYRPPRILLVPHGAEFGWRSGWAKWPDYFPDSLPGIGDLTDGAPTGMVFYQHYTFPKRYHGVLFVGDWLQGRILAVKPERQGATYQLKREVFASGNPMNVTDLEVGPDGWLYFVTGGRGKPGGVYRIVWEGQVPDSFRDLGEGMSAAIRQPQLQSAFSRQKIASLMVQLDSQWGSQLAGVAASTGNPTSYRVRALDLMQLYGPSPTPELLARLSLDADPELRAKVATVMGLNADETTRQRLIEMLDDDHPLVRARTCDALVQAASPVWAGKMDDMLASEDRFEAWAARRVIERVNPAHWEDRVLQTNNHRLFIQGAIAMLAASPTEATAKKVTDRISVLMRGFVSDRDFIDILRVAQLALLRGGLGPEDVPQLREQLADEFPAGHPIMNRELVRLLVYLNVTSIADRYLAQLKSAATAQVERLHLGLYLSRLTDGWETDDKFALMRFLETAVVWTGGRSYRGYVQRAARHFAAALTDAEKRLLLAEGRQMPESAFAVMTQLPQRLDAATIEALVRLDEDLLDAETTDEIKRMEIGIVAALARSGDGISLDYLHRIFERDPDRRIFVALGLAQQPGDAHWEYLVRSLTSLHGAAATEILQRLAQSDLAPKNADAYRDLIILGLTLPDDRKQDAVQLLEKWSGQSVAATSGTPTESLVAWRQWFARTYPDSPTLRPIAGTPQEAAPGLSRMPDETTNK